MIELLKEFKDVFAWTYKDLKGIPPEIAQHRIELDTIVPLAHQARYRLNLDYVVIVKQNIDKLFDIGFIKLVEEVIWLSSIMVVPKKNRRLGICLHFKKLNVVTKKDPYSLPFTNEVINTIVGDEVYTFMNEFSRYHQISIALEDQHKTTFVIDSNAFAWVVMPFGVKNRPPTY